MAIVLQSEGRDEESRTMQRRAIAGYEALGAESRGAFAESLARMALLAHDAEAAVDALGRVRLASAEAEAIGRGGHPDTARLYETAGLLLMIAGRYDEADAAPDEAVDAHRRVYGDGHVSVVRALSRRRLDDMSAVIRQERRCDRGGSSPIAARRSS